MFYFRVFCACVLALFVAGCATIALKSFDGGINGVPYYLPKSLWSVTVVRTRSSDASRPVFTIAITEQRVPDPDQRYVLAYEPARQSEDRLCISRTETGLLQEIEFSSDDKTPEIAFQLARTIAGVAQLRQAGNGSRSLLRRDEPEVLTFKGLVDPANANSRRALNDQMERFYSQPVRLSFDSRIINKASENTKNCPEDHICFRTIMKMPVVLKEKVGGGKSDFLTSTYASAVNMNYVGSIVVDRAVLVEKLSRLKFKNGVLLGLIIKKPSEALAAASLPLSVMSAILTVPADFVSSMITSDDMKTVLSNQNEMFEKIDKFGTSAENNANFKISCSSTFGKK